MHRSSLSSSSPRSSLARSVASGREERRSTRNKLERERGEWRNAPTSLVSQKWWDYRGDTRVTSIPFSPILRVILSDVSDIPLARFAKPQTDPSLRANTAIHRFFSLAYPTILTHLALVVVDYSPSKPLSPVEPCRSVATRPATPRNVGSGIMQKAAAEQCAPRRCTRMEEARKRLDGRENVAPSPFIRIADSEARTTVPFFSLAFQNSVCHALKGKLFAAYRVIFSFRFFRVQVRETLEHLAQLRATGSHTRWGNVEKSIG